LPFKRPFNAISEDLRKGFRFDNVKSCKLTVI
jgi:hypothetical protein